MNKLYDEDFYAWAFQQAEFLRAGNMAAADIGNIAEEIESMGRSEKRKLISRVSVLLSHLLKWQFQPNRQSPGRRVAIENQRHRIETLLADNPSLRSKLNEVMAAA